MSAIQNRSLVLLGDSYTTFKDHIPEGNYVYYPREAVPDVTDVEMTWWRILIRKHDLRLLCNESSSGTTISAKVRETHTIKDAFINRMKRVLGPEGVNGQKPELIIIMGGTNDSWIGNEAGQMQLGEWTDENLLQVIPAACYMLDYITAHNPSAQILFLINCGLRPEIESGLISACTHYGVPFHLLQNISKQNGHPDVEGMRQIAQQAEQALCQP